MIQNSQLHKTVDIGHKHSSELSRIVTADAFENAFVKFIEQADKNAISKKANGSMTPYGFQKSPECDGARFKQQFGQGTPSMSPYMNWWVVSIYYIVDSGDIVVGIEENRYPQIKKMTPLDLIPIGKKKIKVAMFYKTTKYNINYIELYNHFLNVCEEVMNLDSASHKNQEEQYALIEDIIYTNSSENIQQESMYVGLTDANWIKFIKEQKDNIGRYINFWTPGTKMFKAIQPDELFLFKLHSKKAKGEKGEIVGGAYFDGFEQMSMLEAWNRFGYGNGTASQFELKSAIDEYRMRNNMDINADIGCIVLRDPFFFEEDKWIESPADWKKSIVSGRKYDISEGIGYELYQQVSAMLNDDIDEIIIADIEDNADKLQILGKERETFIKARVNQSMFRERLLNKYDCCCLCKVSNPKFLIASHIKPWADSENDEKLDADNGFLLCPNHDALFDSGYISFDDNGTIMISEELGQVDSIFMNVDKNMKIRLSSKNKKYLEYHRNNIFKK